MTGVDQIIHGGDIGHSDIIGALRKIAPVAAIRGNVDTGDWAGEYADTELVRFAGRAIFVLHDLKTLQIDPVALGIDVVVSGHSHVPKIDTVGGVLYLNPGSAGRRRFKLPITLATIEITPDSLRPVMHDLERDLIPREVLEGPLQRGRLEKDERGSERDLPQLGTECSSAISKWCAMCSRAAGENRQCQGCRTMRSRDDSITAS